ncbi:MAG TPA: hypothetical protein VM103_01570 [Candidatus Paceibacterota bacterium]|nr:hypothetical protein [Candidatus Paceibacterota bacterium]
MGLDVGQANELKLAFRRYDWSNTLIKRLCETDVLGNALDILRGDAVAVPVKRRVNLSADPVLEEGHSVLKHLRQGKHLWSEIRLTVMNPRDLQYTFRHLPSEANFRSVPEDSLNRHTLMPRFLRGQRPANICMRDYLLANQHLIPDGPRDWFDGTPLLFWGTICRNDHCPYVPGMSRYSGKWEESDRRVDLPPPDAKFSRLSDTHYENPCVVFA